MAALRGRPRSGAGAVAVAAVAAAARGLHAPELAAVRGLGPEGWRKGMEQRRRLGIGWQWRPWGWGRGGDGGGAEAHGSTRGEESVGFFPPLSVRLIGEVEELFLE